MEKMTGFFSHFRSADILSQSWVATSSYSTATEPRHRELTGNHPLWPWCGLYHSVAPMNQNCMTSVLRSCTQTSNGSSMGQYDVEGCVRYSAVIRRPLELSPLHLSKTCIYLSSMGPNPPAHTLTQQEPRSAGCKTYLVSEHQQDSICDLIQHCSSAVSPCCIQPNTEGSQWPATYFALCRGWQKPS